MNVTYELVRLNGGYLYYYPFVHYYEIRLNPQTDPKDFL